MIQGGCSVALLVLDVDGVLTDGTLYYGSRGQVLSRFHVHDGLGIKALQSQGIEVALVTAKASKGLAARAKELGIEKVCQGVQDKSSALRAIAEARNVPLTRVAYVGDDLTDLPPLAQVGFPIAVANAVPQVKDAARYVTQKPGGHGAVREVCDLLLRRAQAFSPAMGIIPARYDSTRFPGKPLADLAGKPMIWHVYQRARASKLDEVVVATDDQRILDTCAALGCKAVLTSRDHVSGTDRVAQVAADSDPRFERFVNIQGDEPLIPPSLIDALLDALAADPRLDLVTARKRIDDPRQLADPNVVKVVADQSGRAIYFSREPIPHQRDALGPSPSRYRHIGIYVYVRPALLRLAALPPTPLERAESLEQLRALEHGMTIGVLDTHYESVGVDTPDDLHAVRRALEAGGDALCEP